MFDFGDIKDEEIGTIGFDAKEEETSRDFLNRKKTGEQLSDLIERTEYPMVVALDGAWGSGKSHFLKLWAGAHKSENKGTARVIYFDAFKHDYLDDPLIALTLTISSHLQNENTPKTKQIINGFKRLAPAIGKSALRISAAVATAGASEAAASVMSDAFIDASAKEISASAENFWKTEQSRISAMEIFRTILAELTEPNVCNDQNEASDRGGAQKLVIIVDELDRCRPDYALSLLEILKHFFNVANVHIVLGVRLEALENSVKARYGNGINATLYLQKFIQLTMRLPDKYDGESPRRIETHYIEDLLDALPEPNRVGTTLGSLSTLNNWIIRVRPESAPSLRSIQRILVALSLVPQKFARIQGRQRHLIIAGAILKVQAPQIYHKIFASKSTDENRLVCDEIKSFFSTVDANSPADVNNEFLSIWSAYLIPGVADKSFSILSQPFEIGVDTLANIYREYLEVFEPYYPR